MQINLVGGHMETEELIGKLNKYSDSFYKELEGNAKKAVLIPPEKKLDARYRKEMEREALNKIRGPKQDFEEGMDIIFRILRIYAPNAYTQVTAWFAEHLDDIITSAMNDREEENEFLQQKFKIPDRLLEVMYGTVEFLTEARRYEEAVKALMICISLNPTIVDFWMQYGHILQNLQQHESALFAFQMAEMFDAENPTLYAYMAKSWLDLEMPIDADECIDKALALCENEDAFAELVDYCNMLREISNRLKEGEIL